MDFGAFILEGLLLFGLAVSIVALIFLAIIRSKLWKTAACASVALLTICSFGALYIYKVYYLDEGLVGAAITGDAREAEALLILGADPNARWEDGVSALEKARNGNHQDVVRLLLEAGAKESPTFQQP
jgi:hypothetical protein